MAEVAVDSLELVEDEDREEIDVAVDLELTEDLLDVDVLEED